MGASTGFVKVTKTIAYKNVFLVSPSSPSPTPFQLSVSALCSYKKVGLKVLIYKGVLTQMILGSLVLQNAISSHSALRDENDKSLRCKKDLEISSNT